MLPAGGCGNGALFIIFSLPVVVLNTFGFFVSGAWLLAIGQWRAVVAGLVARHAARSSRGRRLNPLGRVRLLDPVIHFYWAYALARAEEMFKEMFGFLGLLGFGWWRFSTGLRLLNASNSGGKPERWKSESSSRPGLDHQPSVGLNCSDSLTGF